MLSEMLTGRRPFRGDTVSEILEQVATALAQPPRQVEEGLPRLAGHVGAVHIEATPEGTEARLLKGLRKPCSELPSGSDLVESLAALRRGRGLRPGKKMLLVIDQFEQWLLAKRADENTEQALALRQCDGERVQAIVMVRDDFWMAATRFMRDLEIRLVEEHNSAAVDLFDLRHARKVLTALVAQGPGGTGPPPPARPLP